MNVGGRVNVFFCLPVLTYLAAASIVAKRLHRHADNVNFIGIILHYIC